MKSHVFFPIGVVFPRFSRKKNRATFSPESELTLSVCENVDGGNCVRDCVSAEAEFEAMLKVVPKNRSGAESYHKSLGTTVEL